MDAHVLAPGVPSNTAERCGLLRGTRPEEWPECDCQANALEVVTGRQPVCAGWQPTPGRAWALIQPRRS